MFGHGFSWTERTLGNLQAAGDWRPDLSRGQENFSSGCSFDIEVVLLRWLEVSDTEPLMPHHGDEQVKATGPSTGSSRLHG